MLTIVQVTKHEAELLREMIPTVHISMTSKFKKSKRKRYYVEEAPAVLDAILKIRSEEKTLEFGGC